MKKLFLFLAAFLFVANPVFAESGFLLPPIPSGAGSGDVVGPSSGSTDNAVALFDGPTGVLLQDSDLILDAGIFDLSSNNLLTAGSITSPTFISTTATPNRFSVFDGANTLVSTAASIDLANTITNETGSGSLVFGTSPTIVTPTIASFTNATHNHTNAAGGGTITSAAVSNFDTQVRTSTLNQMAQPTADVSMNSFKITSLATPISSTDAATKAYADAIASGLLTKTSCALASVADVAGTYVGSPTFTITAGGFGAISIDGTTPSVNDRVLLKDQTDAEENGIYVVTTVGDGGTAYVLTRATDFDASAETLTGSYTFIIGGSTNAATGFILTTPATITLDTTELAFTQFSSAIEYVAGDGMTLTSLTFDVGAGTGIVANADDIAVDTTVVATTTNSLTMSNKTLTSPVLTTPTLTSGTQGSVLFLGAAGVISQNNAAFFWNNTSNYLGLGTSSPTANLTINQVALATGSPSAFVLSGGPHTTLTAATEARDISFNLNRIVQFSTGSFATQRAFYIQSPTYSAVGATTITTAATLAISNAPAAGTNMTITRPYSLMSENGNVALTMNSNNGIVVDFLASNAVGTNRTVTFKGALSAASASTDFTLATTGTTRTAGSIFRIVNNATTRFSVAFNGALSITQAAGTSGSPGIFNLTGGAHTTLTASTEAPDVNWNFNRTVQFATGALGQQNNINIQSPTYSFVGASTITKVSGLTISAPNAGANATFENTTAMNVGGNVSLTASTASLFYTGINIPPHTVTFTGNVNMTGASSVNGLAIGQVTLTDGSAVTVTNSSSLYIAGPPIAAGSVTLTNPYSIFVDAGKTRLDGTLQIGATGSSIDSHYSATATNLITASISAAACGNLGTITVTGAAVGDTVYVSPDVDSSATGVEDSDLSWMATVSAANTVTIRACNPTALAINAGDDQEWRADVWHH